MTELVKANLLREMEINRRKREQLAQERIALLADAADAGIDWKDVIPVDASTAVSLCQRQFGIPFQDAFKMLNELKA